MTDSSLGRRVSRFVAGMGEGPVFVHSDAFRVATLVERNREKKGYLAAHVRLLQEAAGDRALWLPTFNYDFPKTGKFSVAGTPSDLGPITEHFRVEVAEWRTPTPIFAVSGIGREPGVSWGDDTDPFGPESVFSRLVAEDGVILYYGDTFHYNTIVHHAERIAGGGPRYRYDKIFRGAVTIPGGAVVEGSLRCHVRPLATGLDYDWPRLLAEALEAGICSRLDGVPQILAASARALTGLWKRQLAADPLALLDARTRKWVEPALEQIGRRFEIGDFEAPDGTVARQA